MRRLVHRSAALLAGLALLALLPLRGQHDISAADSASPAARVIASSAAGAPDFAASIHDEGSCSVCRTLRDARSLASPTLAASAAVLFVPSALVAERERSAPASAPRGGAAPRAPPLA